MNTATHAQHSAQPAVQFTVPNHVVQRYRNRLNDVTMLPSAATDALAVARSPNASVHQFASLIERDPKLSSDVLRYANSSAFSGGKLIERLDRAIGRLGFRACEQIILATSMSSLSRHVPEGLQRAKGIICQHSFATAMIARRLNQMLRLGFHGEEFTCGLMHDFGRILIAIVDTELFAQADPLDFCEDVDVIERERAIIGADHCSIGWWFAKASGIPKSIRDTVRLHHHPERASLNAVLIHLVAAADHIANHHNQAQRANRQPYNPELNASLRFLLLRQYQTLDTRFCDELTLAINEALCDTEILSAHWFR